MTYTADSIRERFRSAAEIASKIVLPDTNTTIPHTRFSYWFEDCHEYNEKGLFSSLLKVTLSYRGIDLCIKIAQSMIEVMKALPNTNQARFISRKAQGNFILFLINNGYPEIGVSFNESSAVHPHSLSKILFPKTHVISDSQPDFAATITYIQSNDDWPMDLAVLYNLPEIIVNLEVNHNKYEADQIINQLCHAIVKTSVYTYRLTRILALVHVLISNPNRQHEYQYALKSLKFELLYLGGSGAEVNGGLTRRLFKQWIQRGDIESCIHFVDLLGGFWFQEGWFSELPALIRAIYKMGDMSLAKDILLKVFHEHSQKHQIAHDIDYSFPLDYDGSIFVEVAIEMGCFDEAIEFCQSSVYQERSRRLLIEAFARAGNWEKAVSIVSDNIDYLIHTAAQLASELDAIQDGLAFEVLSDCITIAARTHPEWGVVAAMLQDDRTA